MSSCIIGFAGLPRRKIKKIKFCFGFVGTFDVILLMEGGVSKLLNISQKKELVERLSKQLADAEITMVVDYKGLTVLQVTELRAKLRDAGVQI